MRPPPIPQIALALPGLLALGILPACVAVSDGFQNSSTGEKSASASVSDEEVEGRLAKVNQIAEIVHRRSDLGPYAFVGSLGVYGAVLGRTTIGAARLAMALSLGRFILTHVDELQGRVVAATNPNLIDDEWGRWVRSEEGRVAGAYLRSQGGQLASGQLHDRMLSYQAAYKVLREQLSGLASGRSAPLDLVDLLRDETAESAGLKEIVRRHLSGVRRAAGTAIVTLLAEKLAAGIPSSLLSRAAGATTRRVAGTLLGRLLSFVGGFWAGVVLLVADIQEASAASATHLSVPIPGTQKYALRLWGHPDCGRAVGEPSRWPIESSSLAIALGVEDVTNARFAVGNIEHPDSTCGELEFDLTVDHRALDALLSDDSELREIVVNEMSWHRYWHPLWRRLVEQYGIGDWAFQGGTCDPGAEHTLNFEGSDREPRMVHVTSPGPDLVLRFGEGVSAWTVEVNADTVTFDLPVHTVHLARTVQAPLVSPGAEVFSMIDPESLDELERYKPVYDRMRVAQPEQWRAFLDCCGQSNDSAACTQEALNAPRDAPQSVAGHTPINPNS